MDVFPTPVYHKTSSSSHGITVRVIGTQPFCQLKVHFFSVCITWCRKGSKTFLIHVFINIFFSNNQHECQERTLTYENSYGTVCTEYNWKFLSSKDSALRYNKGGEKNSNRNEPFKLPDHSILIGSRFKFHFIKIPESLHTLPISN